jgi:hypothetical protein
VAESGLGEVEHLGLRVAFGALRPKPHAASCVDPTDPALPSRQLHGIHAASCNFAVE